MDYVYTAIDPRGARVAEQVAADTEDQAIRRLQALGYIVLSLSAAAEARARRRPLVDLSWRPGRRVKLDQVVALTREFAILMETGVPVTEALESLTVHADNPAIREALAAVHADLSGGRTMAQAMAAHPRVFPPVYVDMVRTAEAGGDLDETLNRAADYLEASLEMRRKVVAALTYPAVLLVVAIGVLIFMMTYLLPQFQELFARTEARVPPSTQMLLAASAFLRGHWWLVPAGFVGAVYGAIATLRTSSGRDLALRALHGTPVVGDVARKLAMTRILRTLGTLTGSGVSLLIALETAAHTAQDAIYERAMEQISERVEGGTALAEAVAGVGVFPPIVCQMVAVGEKTGRLSAVLMRVAQYYEREVDARLKMLTSVIEPVMIVLLGLLVGFIAISIIAPIYDIMGNVK